MRKLTVILLGALTVGACTEDGADAADVPGRAAPSCTMTWQAFRVTDVESGWDRDAVTALAFDLDHKANDGVDNAIGKLLLAMTSWFPESWHAPVVFDARLAAGPTHWVIEVGRCADGDETRVVSARATDVDGDGTLEIVDRGLAAVGHATAGSSQIAGELGVGWVPVGGLFAGSPTAATDAWQRGMSLAAALTVTDGVLSGRIGIGINPDTDESITPVQNFFNERLAAGTSPFARDSDRNRDGTIDGAETRAAVLPFLSNDLDLADGICDDPDCYAPLHGDRIPDHASLGLAIFAANLVELE